MPGSLLLTPLYLMFTKAGLLNNYPAPVMAIATESILYCLSYASLLSQPAQVTGRSGVSMAATRSPPYAHHAPIARRTSDLHGIASCGWNDLIYSMTFNVKAAMRPYGEHL